MLCKLIRSHYVTYSFELVANPERNLCCHQQPPAAQDNYGDCPSRPLSCEQTVKSWTGKSVDTSQL